MKIDGKEVASEGFGTSVTGAIILPSFAEHFTAGAHEIELEMLEGSAMPYSISITYTSLQDDSSKECIVDFTAELSHKVTTCLFFFTNLWWQRKFKKEKDLKCW